MDAIKGFFGPFRFLSNFHFAHVVYDGIGYRTTEHAYQASKSADRAVREVIRQVYEPKEAKRLGQQIILSDDWHTTSKFQVMLDITRLKYQHEHLRQWLLDTGDAYIEETNTWNDTCWGVCNGVGDNNLGKILMRVREEIRTSE